MPVPACEFLKTVEATEKRPFHLYLVVPRDIYTPKLSQSITDFNKITEEQRDMLSKCLVHHVLVVDDESQTASATESVPKSKSKPKSKPE